MPTLRLRFPSNKTLGNICVYGAIASISAVMYMQWKIRDRVREAEYYRLALKTLRQHKGAVNLLGEPIKDSGFDLSNTNNSCDASYANFEVNVRGSKDKGTVYFWATHNNENGWLIDRLELETKQHPNKRFLLKPSRKEQLDSDSISKQAADLNLNTTYVPEPKLKEPLDDEPVESNNPVLLTSECNSDTNE